MSSPWAVLEDVVLDAVVDPFGCLVASTNVRRVAGHVGMSKDAAAAALTRLARRGLIERRPAGRATGGRFGRSLYVIHLDTAEGVTHLDGHPTPGRSGLCSLVSPAGEDGGVPQPAGERSQAEPSRRRTRGSARTEQASLFDSVQEPAR